MAGISPPSNLVCPAGVEPANYNSIKWISWAPDFHDTLVNISLDCLSNTLQHLPLNRTTHGFLSGYCVICEDVFDCIQNNLTLFDQASFSSSTVILGVGPALLSLVAPSVGELCMLAANRPFLSTLISLGAPSAFCFRPLAYDDPLDYLAPSRTVFSRQPLRPGASGRAYMLGSLISLAEYILIGAASGNVVHASWLLGQQTILSWGCESSYRPFIWTMLSFAMQLISSQSWHFSNAMRAVRANEKKERAARGGDGGGGALGRAIAAEVTPNAARRKRGFFEHRAVSESRWIVFANIFAQLSSLVLALYGTVTLSSLLLIGVRDSFYFTLRFFFSALACRCVLMFELSGMSAVENDNGSSREQGGGEGQWVELQNVYAPEASGKNERKR